MNRRPSGFLILSKAMAGFTQFKLAEGIAQRTITNYENDLKTLLERLGDVPVNKITTQDLRGYLSYMRTEYKPKRFSGQDHPLAPKSLRNMWVSMASFFHWISDEFKLPNPMKGVPAPHCKKPPVSIFTKEEIEALLKACDYSREAQTNDRRKFVMRRVMGKRDRALLLTLLDTGMRANELCSLKIEDLDLKTGKVTIKHGVQGGAKGGKGRVVYLGKSARRSVWLYLTEREDGEDGEAPLFLAMFNRPLNPGSLRQVMNELGKKAEVKKCHPHRFRHTFAVVYLRSGGDVFTLQALLGHSTLDMVRYYAQVAEIDIERVHKKASPADNWRL